MINKVKKGYITLLSVLVVGVISFGLSLGMMFVGIHQTQASLVGTYAHHAQSISEACGEYVLQMIRNTTGFNGSGIMNIFDGSCSYDVTDLGGEARQIEIEGSYNNTIKRVQIVIDGIVPVINIESWNNVESF